MRHEERVAADDGVRLDEMFIEEYEAPLTLTIDIEEGAILEREDDDDDVNGDRPTIETLRPAWIDDLVAGSGKKRSKSRTIGLFAIVGAVGLGILAWGLSARKPRWRVWDTVMVPKRRWFARLGFAS